MALKTRLKKLERLLKVQQTHENCICFPADEPPLLELKAEIESARAVLCPEHGVRFRHLARTTYRVIRRPAHLEPRFWSWHSAQYIKAMKASFPADRWPATMVTDPDGTVRFVLKDGTEIHRIEPEPEILEYHPPCGF